MENDIHAFDVYLVCQWRECGTGTELEISHSLLRITICITKLVGIKKLERLGEE